MSFFGMYPSNFNYFGIYGGMHPSYRQTSGVNYNTGEIIPNANTFANKNAKFLNPTQGAFSNEMQTPAKQELDLVEKAFIQAKNKQGGIGKFSDGLKNFTGIGLGSKKCAQYIEDFKKGNIALDQVQNKINKFSAKQTASLNIISGIAAGLLSAAAISKGKTDKISKFKNVLTACIIGATAKSSIKLFDRGTNKVENDAFAPKEIAKDAISGALNGAMSVYTIGTGKNTIAAESAKEAVKTGVITGAKSGAAAGAFAGAGDYCLECTFDENQEFKPDILISNTINSAAAGAVTGAIFNGVSSYKNFNKINPSNNPPPSSNNNPNKPSSGGPAPVEPEIIERIDPNQVQIIPPDNNPVNRFGLIEDSQNIIDIYPVD